MSSRRCELEVVDLKDNIDLSENHIPGCNECSLDSLFNLMLNRVNVAVHIDMDCYGKSDSNHSHLVTIENTDCHCFCLAKPVPSGLIELRIHHVSGCQGCNLHESVTQLNDRGYIEVVKGSFDVGLFAEETQILLIRVVSIADCINPGA